LETFVTWNPGIFHVKQLCQPEFHIPVI